MATEHALPTTHHLSDSGRHGEDEPVEHGHHAMFRVRGESFTEDQMHAVLHSDLQQDVLNLLLDAKLPFSEPALNVAVTEFFTTLGLPRLYFDTTPAEVIASHVHSLLSARELARSAGRPADVSLSMESEHSAFFAARSLIITDRASGQAGRDASLPAWLSPANLLERYLETKYLQQGEATRQAGDADFRALQAHGQPGQQKKETGKPSGMPIQAQRSLSTAPMGDSSSNLMCNPATGCAPSFPGATGTGTGAEGTQPIQTLKITKPETVASPSPQVTPVAVLPGAGPTGATVTQLPEVQGAGMTGGPGQLCWRLQCYRSRGVLEDGSHLRLYFLQAPEFEPLPAPLDPNDTSLENLGDSTFLARVSPELRDAYQKVVTEASQSMHPAIHLQPYTDLSQGEDSDVLAVGTKAPNGSARAPVPVEGLLLMVGHRLGSTHSFFSGLPDIYRWHGMYAVAKFVEVFRNGIVVFTFRLRSLQPQAVVQAAPSLPLTGAKDFAASLLDTSRTPRRSRSRESDANHSITATNKTGEPRSGYSSSSDTEHEQPARLMPNVPVPSPPRVAASPQADWTPIPPMMGQSVMTGGMESEGGPRHHAQLSTLMPSAMMPRGTGDSMGVRPAPGSSEAPGPSRTAPVTGTSPQANEPEYVRILRERRLAKLSAPGAGILSPERQKELARDVGLHFVLPRTSLSPLLTQGLLSAQEVSYAYAAWKFAYHFLSRASSEFGELAGLVKGSSVLGTSGLAGTERAAALGLISRLRKALQSAAFTEAAILDCMYRQVHVVAWLFDDFCSFNKPRTYVTSAGAAVYTPNPVSAALLRATSHSKSGSGDDKGMGQPGATKGASFTFDAADPGAALRAHARARLTKGLGGPAAAAGFMQPTGAETPGGAAVIGQQVQVPLEQAIATLRKMCGSGGVSTQADDVTILTSFLVFNRAVCRSNLFRSSGRTALAFKLDPSKGFLSKTDFPDTPFAVFLVVGAEFRGFHVRFSDVARGGIRLLKSGSAQAYGASLASLWEEVYTLAHTQSRKNKDLPEGGSKGIILLNLAHQDKARVAFQKYVDGLLDLLTPAPSGEEVTAMGMGSSIGLQAQGQGQGQQELLFLGPDENTAELMDWASQHARVRGYSHWKAFTTGKAPSAGGMPHDTFGMTSRGVRAFEMGVQRHLALGPWAVPGSTGARVTKLQTGGPDGDLGSNEILLTGSANEVYIGIVDGSGVLADLDGLDYDELCRLAHDRKPVEGYNRALLGPRGFLITVKDTDVTLPQAIADAAGAASLTVPFGLAFRNNAHMMPFLRAETFIPCGGRPASVDMSNVEPFLYGPTKLPEDALLVVSRATTPIKGQTTAAPAVPSSRLPRFTYIVEGANSFFTNDARLFLDTRGITVIKDASANKGGVTASSLEVLAALALKDAEHSENMCTAEGADVKAAVAAHRAWQAAGGSGPLPVTPGVPPFYAAYVCDAQDAIASNAVSEFDALWREKDTSGRPLPTLSDSLSVKITELSRVVRESDVLWNDLCLRRAVLAHAVPPTLAQLLGGPEAVLARLPQQYVRALFASRLASQFVYACGLDKPGTPPEFAFWAWTRQMAASAGPEGGAAGQEQPLSAQVPAPAAEAPAPSGKGMQPVQVAAQIARPPTGSAKAPMRHSHLHAPVHVAIPTQPTGTQSGEQLRIPSVTSSDQPASEKSQ